MPRQPSLFEPDEPEREIQVLGGPEAQQRWDEQRKGCHWVKCAAWGDTVIHVKLGSRSANLPRCPFCGERSATKLCDYPAPGGKTCDARSCSVCARHVGRDRDFCPNCVKKLEKTI
jgi:hypothetical protein